MKSYKKIMVLALLVGYTSFGYAVDDDTKYFFKFNNQTIQLTKPQVNALNSTNFLEDFVEDNENDDSVYNNESNEFTYDFDRILANALFKNDTSVDDIQKFIVAASPEGLLPIGLLPQQLINITNLSDFLGHEEVLDACAQQIASLITLPAMREYFGGTDNIINLVRDLPQDIINYKLAHLIGLKTYLEGKISIPIEIQRSGHLSLIPSRIGYAVAYPVFYDSHGPHLDICLLDLQKLHMLKKIQIPEAFSFSGKARPLLISNNKLIIWGRKSDLELSINIVDLNTYTITVREIKPRPGTMTFEKIIYFPPATIAVHFNQIDEINIININSGEIIDTLHPPAGTNYRTYISLYAGKIATSQKNNGEIHIWNLTSLKTTAGADTPEDTLTGHTHPVNKLIPVGELGLISEDQSNTIKFWNLKPKMEMASFHGKNVTLLSGNKFAYHENDNTIVVRKMRHDFPVSTRLRQSTPLRTYRGFSPVPDNEDLLVTNDTEHTAKVWDLRTKKVIATIPENLQPFGNNLFAYIQKDNSLRVIKLFENLNFDQRLALAFFNRPDNQAAPVAVQNFPRLYEILKQKPQMGQTLVDFKRIVLPVEQEDDEEEGEVNQPPAPSTPATSSEPPPTSAAVPTIAPARPPRPPQQPTPGLFDRFKSLFHLDFSGQGED